MAEHVSWTLSSLSHLARAGSWNDEIALVSSRRITLDSRARLPWLVQRIVTIVIRAFETIASAIFHRPIVIVDRTKKREDLTATVNNLQEMFGRGRIGRAVAWCGINLDTLYEDGICLTKQDFAMLFHRLALITLEDVQELLSEINGEQLSVRGIRGEQLRALRDRFQGKTVIASCTAEEVRVLESMLLPFATPKDLFWNTPSDHLNAVSFPVTTFEMVETVAWARHLLQTRRFSLKEWEHLFAKRMAQAQLPHNLIVLHPDNGYLCFSHLVEGGGASKRFFRSLHPDAVSPVILYRGTRGPMPGDGIVDTVRSWLEDLRRELGASGPIATYEETKQLLDDPEKGFVNSPGQQVALITNSIGGAQGQRDALCFHRRISRLTTVCSPGVDAETAALFREVISQPRSVPMVITHIIDKGDIVDRGGDEHLGANCDNVSLTFRSLTPRSEESGQEAVSWTPAIRLHDFLFGGISSLFCNIEGIFQAHVRATTVGAYREEEISTDDPQTRALAIAYARHSPPHFDPSWEQVRRYFCPAPSPGFAAFARGCLSLSPSDHR